uniref:Cysteine-rich DPF motif domain-containing protein 1 n=1 Tax=Labrus bergylta TaxID=56723 RepID=A0A3Q3NQT0_9LABR
MEQTKSEHRQKSFTCQSCGLSSPFTTTARNHLTQELLEECFVTRDPFSPDKEKFLVLGSTCSLCSMCVCVAPECSLFYTKRFCMQCVNKHLDQFPQQIRAELAKKKQSSKAAIS